MTDPEVQTAPPRRGRSWLRHWSVVAGKWLLLAAALAASCHFLDWDRIGAGFGRIPLWAFLLFLLVNLLCRVLYTGRWTLICRKALGLDGASFPFLLRTNLLGEFVGIAMPTSIGAEAVRVAKLGARTESPVRSVASLVADRLIGVAVMGLMAVFLLPQLGVSLAKCLSLPRSVLWAAAAVVPVALGGIGYWFAKRGGYRKIAGSLKKLKLSVSLLASLVGLTAAGHLLLVAGYYLLFQEIQATGFWMVFALIMVSQLARIVPVSVLGIGLSEGSLLGMAGLAGLTAEDVVPIVAMTLAARYLLALSGLGVELATDGRRFLKARAEGKEQDREDGNDSG